MGMSTANAPNILSGADSAANQQPSNGQAAGGADSASGASGAQSDEPPAWAKAILSRLDAIEQRKAEDKPPDDSKADEGKPAEGKQGESLSDIDARIAAIEAESKLTLAQLTNRLAESYVGPLVSRDVVQLLPKLELTSDRTGLTAESIRRLDDWKKANGWAIKPRDPSPSTPTSGASSRATLSPEATARLAQQGIVPGKWQERPGARLAQMMAGGAS